MGTLKELPPELLAGWAFWIVGGMLLMVWFIRRSASPRLRPTPPAGSAAAAVRLSGTHPSARPRSGVHTVARQHSGTVAAARPSGPGLPPATSRPSPAADPDAYDELRALLDPPDPPHGR